MPLVIKLSTTVPSNVLTKVLTGMLEFPVFISAGYMLFAIIVCIIVGIIAGFIPASQASKLDPVVAIRS